MRAQKNERDALTSSVCFIANIGNQATFQPLVSRAVLLPESFRGGCSFGAHFCLTLQANESLPRGNGDTHQILAQPRDRAGDMSMIRLD